MVELNDFFDGGKITFERLSSLDILTYAYLKEQLVNTPYSRETLYWQANYLNLTSFVRRMDLFIEQNLAIEEIEKREIYLQVDSTLDNLQKITELL